MGVNQGADRGDECPQNLEWWRVLMQIAPTPISSCFEISNKISKSSHGRRLSLWCGLIIACCLAHSCVLWTRRRADADAAVNRVICQTSINHSSAARSGHVSCQSSCQFARQTTWPRPCLASQQQLTIVYHTNKRCRTDSLRHQHTHTNTRTQQNYH